MNRNQRESLRRLLQLAQSLPGYQQDAASVAPLLEQRRRQLKAILPRSDQLPMLEELLAPALQTIRTLAAAAPGSLNEAHDTLAAIEDTATTALA